MPEGDAVWMMARKLQHGLVGTRLMSSDFRVPQLATVKLDGWTVVESASRGKHLLLRLQGPQREQATLHSHLRMDGSWRIYLPGERWTGGPAHTIRVVLRAPAVTAIGYHLHELAIVPTAQESRLVGHLGPDLLGADWDAQEAVRRLSRHPDKHIADALLDQRNLAGIGNIYQTEALFLHHTSPWTPVGAVDDLPGLVTIAQRLLDRNRFGRDRRPSIYGRHGQPCPRCGGPIQVTKRGDRVTYWCPKCQPLQALSLSSSPTA